MHKQNLGLLGLLVILALFFSINLASGALFRSVRADLTDNKLYTLSQGTRNILRDMEEPVTLRFYFSRKLANEIPDIAPIRDYARRVQELLEEYVSYGGGKLTLYVIDPEPFSEEEDQAVAFGLQGAPANRAGEPLYFGLAGTNTTDEEEVVPFFDTRRQEFLEYDLTRLVYRLAFSDETVVGLLTTLPMEGAPPSPFNPQAQSSPWLVLDQIRGLCELRTIPTTSTEIPEDIDVLLAVHPKEHSDELLYSIDQYVLKGGKLLAFMDAHCESDPVPQDPNNPLAGVSANRTSDLGDLLEAWGLELVKDRVAGDRTFAAPVGWRNQPIDFILWLMLDQRAVDGDDPVSSELDSLVMKTAGILRPLEGATTSFHPLLETSEESMEVDRINVAIAIDPPRLLNDFAPSGQRLALAARVSGQAVTAFPDGPPGSAEPGEDSQTGEEDPPAEGDPPSEEDAGSDQLTEGEIQVIVVSDADMLADNSWVRLVNVFGNRLGIPQNQNADLLTNAIDNLSGNSDLISLRSRPSFGRPFDLVVEKRREADERFRSEEQELQESLREIDDRIRELQAQKEGDAVSALILSPEQREEIERAEEERLSTRKRLREVRHSLQKDIERLGLQVKALNIVAWPLVLGILALLLYTVRYMSRRI